MLKTHLTISAIVLPVEVDVLKVKPIKEEIGTINPIGDKVSIVNPIGELDVNKIKLEQENMSCSKIFCTSNKECAMNRIQNGRKCPASKITKYL